MDGKPILCKESFLHAREPSVDRRFRPCPKRQVVLFNGTLFEENEDNGSSGSGDGTSSTTTTTNATTSSSSSNKNKSHESDIHTDKANVYLRLRPSKMNGIYKTERDILTVNPMDNTTTSAPSNLHQKNIATKQFKFTGIFNDTTEQKKIYNECIAKSIENGDNMTVLTYGTSGSGKTYTLLGDENNPGVIIRAIEHLFRKYEYNICGTPTIKLQRGNMVILSDEEITMELKKRELHSHCTNNKSINNHNKLKSTIAHDHTFTMDERSNKNVLMWISFAEIYNEHIYDLLSASLAAANRQEAAAGNGFQKMEHMKNNFKRTNLKILMNDGNSVIKDLTSVFVRSSEEAYQLLVNGLLQVNYALTNINEHSSRSHCIYFIDVIVSEPNACTHISYKFCDLAGSERLKKTDNIGNRLKEAQRINTSLMVLGRCLESLYTNQQQQQQQQKQNNEVHHQRSDDNCVPIRDSKLTMLLQAPLLGHEKITMIVNLYPTIEFYEENLHVLKFSSIATQIKYIKSQQIRKNRSTRFSFFLSQAMLSSSPSKNNTQANVSLILDENYRLHQENNELREHILQQNLELERKINDIRKTLTQQYQELIYAKCDMYNKRIIQLEKFYKHTIAELNEQNRNKKEPPSEVVTVDDSDDSYEFDDDDDDADDEEVDDEVVDDEEVDDDDDDITEDNVADLEVDKDNEEYNEENGDDDDDDDDKNDKMDDDDNLKENS